MARDTVLLAIYPSGSAPNTVLRLVGVLDIGTVGTLRESVKPHLVADGTVVLDLAEVTFCDSTGIGAIVGLYRTGAEMGCDLILQSPQRRVAAILSMTGVDQVVAVRHIPGAG
jgi:anti-sigma B factor antagonist